MPQNITNTRANAEGVWGFSRTSLTPNFIFHWKFLITKLLCTVDSRYRTRLSRITAYHEMKIWSLPKHENLTTGKKYCRKEDKLLLRSNFSSFPQYFQYISNFKSPIHIYLLNVVNRIIFSWTLQICYVEVRISRSISESPLAFEITRINCICL